MSVSAFSQSAERAPEAAPTMSKAVASAGWFLDPLDRFSGRFFDGEQWTNQVSDDGVLRLDPSWALSPLATPSQGPERRGAYDRRQITIKVDVDRRKGDRRAS